MEILIPGVIGFLVSFVSSTVFLSVRDIRRQRDTEARGKR